MRVHLVHGIHTPPNDPTVRELIPYLTSAGLEVAYPDYGLIAAIETRLVNPIIVRSILPYIEAGDVWVGHSNGCAIGYDLMNLGVPLVGAVFIDAALTPRITRPPLIRWMDVYFNPGDQATEAAELAGRLGWVDPVWGEMGHSGYEGVDPAITNVNCGTTAGMPVVSGHSDIFTSTKLAKWGPFIVQRITKALAS